MIIRTNKRVHSEAYISKVLYAKDKSLRVVRIDKVYYPYAIMIYRIQMRNPKSQMNRKIMCVMDMVAGRGAIGKDDPVLTEIEADEIMLVEPRLGEKELCDKSHDYVFKMIMGKIRVLYVPEIMLEKTDFFHKLFYIVHCKDAEEQDYFLLADPMDASFTVLDC